MIRASLFAVALLAAACAPSNTTPPPDEPAAQPQTAAEATARDTCGASQYRTLIGAQIAAVTFPADSNIRVIMPDSMVTEDFRPDRLNVIVDTGGVITALECY
ncbi:MAG: I78 family peptidase inhibitor [Hyphomonadaceae bacterium]